MKGKGEEDVMKEKECRGDREMKGKGEEGKR